MDFKYLINPVPITPETHLKDVVNVSAFTLANIIDLIGGELVRDLLLFAPEKVVSIKAWGGVVEAGLDPGTHSLGQNSGQISAPGASEGWIILKILQKTVYDKHRLYLAQDMLGKRISLIFFGKSPAEAKLVKDASYCFIGKIEKGTQYAMYHPEIWPAHYRPSPLVPVYTATQNKLITKIIHSLLSRLETPNQVKGYTANDGINDSFNNCPYDWISPQRLAKEHWLTLIPTLHTLHLYKITATPPLTMQKYERCYERLAFDELLAHSLQTVRSTVPPFALNFNLEQIDELLAGIPYSLTTHQLQAVQAIIVDMQNKRMLRMLYGEVGSGKTLVAFLIALIIIDRKSIV